MAINNPAFQKTVNTFPAIGKAGELASQNPAYFFPGNPQAAEDGVIAARFVWYDATDETVSNTGTGAPSGIALALLGYPNYDMESGYSMDIAQGNPVTVLQRGDVFAETTNTATVGQVIFANLTTGEMQAGDSGDTVAGHIETGFVVLKNVDDVLIISNGGA